MDDQSDFPERMARQLHELAGQTYDVIAISDDLLSEANSHVLSDNATVAIMPLSWKSRLPIQHFRVNHSCLFWDEPPLPGQSLNPHNHDDVFVSRYAGARRLDFTIRDHLADQIPFNKTEIPIDNRMGIHLSFSQAVSMRTTRYILNREMSHGRTVIYLPVKPLYSISESFRRGPGDTLGELFCRISSGDLPGCDDLGSLLYLHERGYYTFRLPERADDLIACNTEYLRQLAHLLRAYTRSRPAPATAWIDASGLVLDKLLSMAVLCDFIYVDAPEEETCAAHIARRELGLFLARLPNSCAILELPGKDRKLTASLPQTVGQDICRASGL